MHRLVIRCIILLAAATPGVSQCAYPPMPRAGFSLTEILDTPITFGDGAKTFIDVLHPTTKAACGWPIVFHMHGMGGSRVSVRKESRRLARLGFAVACWDVRGQGDAKKLNSAKFGFKYVGDTERLDIVEIVDHMRRKHGPQCDSTRLGMHGFSQAAIYSWAAAAWSGRSLPTNPRNLKTFPIFKAVCPMWWAPLTGSVIAPEGKAITGRLFSVLYEFSADITMETSWFQTIDRLIRNEDFAGVAAHFDADPFRQEMKLLATSKVPVFTQVSWNDDWVPLADTLDTFARLPKSTPRRGFLTFPGHDGPRSTKPLQPDLALKLSDRWFERFLKDRRNGVETETLYITGPVNQTRQEFLGWEPVWNRYRSAWPPPGRSHRSYFLRTGGKLSETAPTGPEPDDLVRHTVPSTYNMAGYIFDRGHTLNVLKRIKVISIPYDTAPLSDDFEIAGAPSVEIEVVPNGKNYQLHCALFRVEPDDSELFLASGVALMRETSVHPVRVMVTMNEINALVRRGQRLRLRLENLTYRKVHQAGSLICAPYFESVDIKIRHFKSTAESRISKLTIPLLPGIAPSLLTSHLSLDVSRNPIEDVLYRVRAPTYPRSTPYVIVFGGAGMSPGYTWAGQHVHMNWDPILSNLFLSALNSSLLPYTLGTLGSQATNNPRLVLNSVAPIPATAAGFRIIAIAALSDGTVTNPVDLFLR